ncbi:epimerase [Enterococcus florum]|uniref:Epimerase n=1 Tax=Enterococcus florum TaxID=2480627 RepID=A0A4P5PCB0_9ENTE|nr:NAD-dependent epimerase/dehydratase family protein [Enterococcus florum]GCF93921.1 epimerase [Enterococcus florum]
MSKILITGGAGFIGSNLANHLLKKNEVIVIDDLSMGKKENLSTSKGLTFIEGNVLDQTLMTRVFKQNQFSYIYHLAAIASVADSVERPVETHAINFDSTLLLLELTRRYQKDLKRFIFASSAAVYGDGEELPKREESPIIPLTPYAIDKYASERYVANYWNLYQVPTAAVRFFNVYGPNQNPSSPYSGVISILMNKYEEYKRNKESCFTYFGDGSQTRDFVYIDDVVQALNLVAEKNEALGNVYNVGTGNKISLKEIKSNLDEYFSVQLPVKNKPNRKGDIKDSFASIKKLEELGFSPNFSVVDGLRDYLKTLEEKGEVPVE